MSAETKSFVLPFCVIGTVSSNATTTAIEFAAPLSGINAGWNATEAERTVRLGIIGQLSNFSVNCRTFTADVNPTVRTRINDADGNQVLTITATGFLQDTSNVDNLTAVTDNFDYEFDHLTGSTTALILDSITNKLVIQS